MNKEMATFAGGCFWCVQHDFDHVKGILSTAVGYIGGKKTNPSYEEICNGTTGHREAIQVIYDPKQISYEKLLRFFWHMIDPLNNEGQFCDIGFQYRPAIFYHNEEQKRIAEASKREVEKKLKRVSVEILPASTFYEAEAYHQKYYQKNAPCYQSYRIGSGRDKRLKELWKNDNQN